MNGIFLIIIILLLAAILQKAHSLESHLKPITTHVFIAETAFKIAGKAYEERGKADGLHVIRQEQFCQLLAERAEGSKTLPNLDTAAVRERFRPTANIYLWLARELQEKAISHAALDGERYHADVLKNSQEVQERRG